MSKIDKLLQRISEAPEEHITKDLIPRIKSIIGVSNEITATELGLIIADGAKSHKLSKLAHSLLSNALISVQIKD